MTIKLYWSGGGRSEINFGDSISLLIVEHMTGQNAIYADIQDCDMAAIGSILGKICTKSWKRIFKLRFDKIKIWGSGAFSPAHLASNSFLDFLAVRGPMTAAALGRENLPLGDPGLLIDRFEIRSEKKYRWGIIPHIADLDNWAIANLSRDLKNSCVIDLREADLFGTMKKIRSCDFIISTSLHGLITADAFQIPNIWLRVSGHEHISDWKFHDYFGSIGRSEKSPMTADQINFATLENTAKCAQKSAIEKCQTDLIAALQKI